MNTKPRWFAIALLNFLIAACFGIILRLAFVTELNWVEFRYLMHGHSHVAMLGWLYCALFILLVQYFVGDEARRKKYNTLFWLTQISVIGMAVSFPIQGYAGLSIFFSTAHVLLSYIFVVKLWKDLNIQEDKGQSSTQFVKTALVFMTLSTIALFALAPIMVFELKPTGLYYMAVQFFLHFQFNGWFIFAILAILFKLLESWNINPSEKSKKIFYWLLVSSCMLTYALAVTWSNPSTILFLANSIGVSLQLAALVSFVIIVKKHYAEIKSNLHRGMGPLLYFSFISFSLKIVMQSAVVVPYIAKVAYTVRNFVIGFIHLILLGAITFAILAFAMEKGLLSNKSQLFKSGSIVLVLGFLLTETLLFIQGTLFWGAMGFIPYYYEILFGVTCLLPLGVFLILWSTMNQRGEEPLISPSR